jgi:tetratricopeptide (TPR) repeat protein
VTERTSEVQVILLECAPGAARRQWLEEWLKSSPSGLFSCLDCSMQRRGPWAGLDQLFEALAHHLAERAPSLLHEHSYEIVSVAPRLRATLQARYQCLTDVAPEEERVRLFPRDRAMRIPHGLIDLLVKCVDHGILRSPLTLACDALDEAGWSGSRFFAELARRAGPVVGLQAAIGVRPGAGRAVLEQFQAPGLFVHVSEVAVPASLEPVSAPSHDEAEQRKTALSMEAQAARGPEESEALLPSLIRIWSDLGDERRSLEWRAEAFACYTFRGLYADAWEYGRAVVDRLDEYAGQDEMRRFKVINKVFGCIGAIGDQEALRALPAFVISEGLAKLTNPGFRGGVHYILSMLYARFLPELDLDRAENHLELGLAELARSKESEASRRFQMAFNRNGLALIRFRQGRTEEAVDLCREARAELDEYLPMDRQRLHRSVLLYNIAQVYAAIGDLEQALDHLSQAIAKDPEYSEYYNDRGMLRFKTGDLEAAREDYQRAIALSPPYYEVWTNLGQCLRRAKDFEGAIRAYSRSLDLDAKQLLALTGRADCYQELGLLEAAYADYTAVLAMAPESWDCLGNRAVVLYALGRVEESLADLEKAVALAPAVAELRRNRAIALADLGRTRQAREDLEDCLRLDPYIVDRPEILARLEAFIQS